MQAVKGYVENGQFFPMGKVTQLPGRIKAVLTILDEPAEIFKPDNELDFWKDIDLLVDAAADEKMPDFPRLNFGRELITFSEKG